MSRLKLRLPEALAASVKTTIGDWQSGGQDVALWQRDASLWTGSDEADWLGWLDIVEEQIAHSRELQKPEPRRSRARVSRMHSLLGMGGSSLCPEVLRKTFGKIAGLS